MNAVMAMERPKQLRLAPTKPGVLVVDDQPAIRKILQISLERHQIPVWEAADGETAITVYRRHKQSIGLVLLDVRLPGMSGPDTWQVLRDLDSDIPCCFMSGGAGKHTEAELLELGACRFFAKPFSLNVVTETVRSLLAG